jgi:N-acylneuraminate cytidylyltransferase
MIIKALVAVRSGSVRVSSKNVRPFAGSTLTEIKIKQLLRIKQLDGIVVNSNDDEILDICSKYDVELVKRNQYFAKDDVTMSEVYKNMAENFPGDTVVYANATSPLISDQSISKAIATYKEINEQFDSLNTTHLIKEFMLLDGDPINYSLDNQPRSQDLPDIHAINFAISIIEKNKMINYSNVVGRKPYLFVLDEVESVDIDSMLDFEVAEFLFKKQSGHTV